MGNLAANGTRLDVKESGAAPAGSLRVEVQGTGLTTNPANFDNGNWQFVAVTVPNNATFADVAWYVNGGASDLNSSAADPTKTIATGTSPLVFGDSVITGRPSLSRSTRWAPQPP
jgi:hypothetical protein